MAFGATFPGKNNLYRPANGPKTKVLHIITRLDKGGSSENTLLTCIGLDKKKFSLSLLAGQTVEANQALLKEAESEEVKFIFVPELVRRIKLFRDIKALFKIYALIKRERFDMVHTHSSKAGFLGRIAAKLAGVPVIIYTPHGHIFYGYFNCFLTGIFVQMEKLAARFTDKIIILTEGGLEEWVKRGIAPRDKFTAIPSGVRLKSFQESKVNNVRRKKEKLGIPVDTKVVGTVGRFVLIKGHIYLIEAIPGILNEYPEVMFVLVGDGPLMTDLKKKVQTLGLGEKIKFLGWKNDLGQILQIMDIFVLPSLNEGMGRVLVEAMVHSLPVVASKVGGIGSVVIEGKTGLLVPSGQPASLAKAIVELLKNPERAKMMGEEGRKTALSDFSSEEMLRRIDELYQNLLKK